jgi:uncharacterized protein YneF (UPF0154 family)
MIIGAIVMIVAGILLGLFLGRQASSQKLGAPNHAVQH